MNADSDELIVNPDPEKVNLEHVLPQTWTQSAWGNVPQDEHRVLLKRLGNLALLNKRLNSKVANSDFSKKKGTFEASKITLTKEIASSQAWGRAEIVARQGKLADLAVKAWPNARGLSG